MLKKEVGKLFPNLNQTVAYYSPTTFSITLNTISEAEYIHIIQSGKIDAHNIDNISTVYHEMQHHIDHISTLWGQKNILALGKALEARLSEDENQFSEIITYKIAERQLHYTQYYTENYTFIPWTKEQGNWRYAFTSGVKFNHKGQPDHDHPIVFLRFSTNSGTQLTRVPLSIASLLETNAIHSENRIKSSYINSLSGLEKENANKKNNEYVMSEIIYNQQLALYNVAVHLTANLLELSDVGKAFQISSALATIALNLPKEHLSSIPIPEDHNEWGEKCQKLILNEDYGYVFLLLLSNYRYFFLNDGGEYLIERVLLANNLPSKSELEDTIIKLMQSFQSQLESNKNLQGNLTTMLGRGVDFFKLRGLDGTQAFISDLMKAHHKILMIFQEVNFDTDYSSLNHIFRNRPIKALSLEEWFDFSQALDSKMDEFFEVRGL